MAESIVSFVVEKLGKLLIEEAVFLHGVADQVEWVKTELKRMQCFLEDAEDKRRKGDERVRNWVREVRDVAYQVENVIDNVMYMAQKRRLRRGFIGRISRYAHIPKKPISLYKIGREIEGIKNKIRDISDSRQRFGIANLGESGDEVTSNIDDSLQARRRLFPQFHDDRDVVGVEDAKKALIKQLLDLNNARRCVISIVGMGGLGKTTLASRIYNSTDIKSHFSISVWLTVSQDYSIIGLLKGILEKVTSIATDEREKMSEEHVREKIYEILKGVRYLVVLDDVWKDNVWYQIHNVFPDKNNGSRVMLTTRNIDVAKSTDPITPPHVLRLLDQEESWELFCNKAFPGNPDSQTRCPQEELEDLSRRLSRSCGGLPLALVVLGGLLSRKVQTYPVWLNVAESMVWESTADGQQCLSILALSYNDLPHHYLKSCFIYLGAFPEDMDISVSLLIRLWIAEGFIPQRMSQTLEDTARGYLDELVERCMVQVTKKSLAHGWTKRIRIHDMLRDFCISESRKDGIINVCHSTTDISSSSSSTAMAAHRQSIHNFNGELPDFLTDLHSLLILRGNRAVEYHNKLKCLRVLHGQNLIFLAGNQSMKHVRYLSFYRSYVPVLNACTCSPMKKLWPRSLYNLITLDVSRGVHAHDIIWESPTLRHLYIRGGDIRPPATFSFSNLQVLWSVRAGEWIGRSLANHTNLRKLGINNISTSHHKKLITSLQKLGRLVSLQLRSDSLSDESIPTEVLTIFLSLLLRSYSLSDESIPTEVLTIFQNQPHLHVLKLYGKFSKGPQLPPSNEFPPRLTKLLLSNCKLEHDPMPTLEKLPNLIYLHLGNNAYVGKTMSSCSMSGFPRLQYLMLKNLDNMEDWRITGGAMPSLTQLTIRWCSNLAMLPDGLQHVTSLQELRLLGMSKEFIGRVDKDRGEDWYKIQHVPSIIIRDFFGQRRI